jgi:hypothetical protein
LEYCAKVLFVEVPKDDRTIKITTDSATAQTYRNDSNSHSHDSLTMTGPQLRVLTSIILQYALKKIKNPRSSRFHLVEFWVGCLD